jgi:hypothetical protein
LIKYILGCAVWPLKIPHVPFHPLENNTLEQKSNRYRLNFSTAQKRDW